MEIRVDDASPPRTQSPDKPKTQHDALHRIFSYWKSVMDHPDAHLDDKRRIVIHKAMQAGYSVSQLCQAIEGCSYTPYNMGKNDLGQRFDGLHVIFRDADQIDRFIRNCQHPPKQVNEAQKRSQSNLEALQNWLERKIQPDDAEAETNHAEK